MIKANVEIKGCLDGVNIEIVGDSADIEKELHAIISTFSNNAGLRPIMFNVMERVNKELE